MNNVSWEMFLFREKEVVCEDCMSKLMPISGEICLKCGRPLSKLRKDYFHDRTCLDCQLWLKKDSALIQNRSLFEYNDFMKGILALYKYRGDAEAGRVFNSIFSKEIRKSYRHIDGVNPIPLSNERLYERGFNQCEIWLENVPNTINALVRTHHEEKQSKKSKSERMNRSIEMFTVQHEQFINGKTILLIDDLYTTGTTLYHAAQALVHNGAKEVYSLTLCRG